MENDKPVFKIEISCHNQWCIEKTDASKKEHQFLRGIMNDHRFGSKVSEETTKVAAFFQGGFDLKQGWYLIEFWNPDFDACQKFVDFLNEEYKTYEYIDWDV